MKPATSAHFVADVTPFFGVRKIPFESNASIKPKKCILHPIEKNIVRNIFRVFMFRQFLAYKRHRLCDSMSGRAEAWHWSPT